MKTIDGVELQPGPYSVSDNGVFDRVPQFEDGVLVGDRPNLIAQVFWVPHPSGLGSCSPYSVLFAAAPDLVRALQKWKCQICGGDDEIRARGGPLLLRADVADVKCPTCKGSGLDPIAAEALRSAGIAVEKADG